MINVTILLIEFVMVLKRQQTTEDINVTGGRGIQNILKLLKE